MMNTSNNSTLNNNAVDNPLKSFTQQIINDLYTIISEYAVIQNNTITGYKYRSPDYQIAIASIQKVMKQPDCTVETILDTLPVAIREARHAEQEAIKAIPQNNEAIQQTIQPEAKKPSLWSRLFYRGSSANPMPKMAVVATDDEMSAKMSAEATYLKANQGYASIIPLSVRLENEIFYNSKFSRSAIRAAQPNLSLIIPAFGQSYLKTSLEQKNLELAKRDKEIFEKTSVLGQLENEKTRLESEMKKLETDNTSKQTEIEKLTSKIENMSQVGSVTSSASAIRSSGAAQDRLKAAFELFMLLDDNSQLTKIPYIRGTIKAIIIPLATKRHSPTSSVIDEVVVQRIETVIKDQNELPSNQQVNPELIKAHHEELKKLIHSKLNLLISTGLISSNNMSAIAAELTVNQASEATVEYANQMVQKLHNAEKRSASKSVKPAVTSEANKTETTETKLRPSK